MKRYRIDKRVTPFGTLIVATDPDNLLLPTVTDHEPDAQESNLKGFQLLSDTTEHVVSEEVRQNQLRELNAHVLSEADELIDSLFTTYLRRVKDIQAPDPGTKG